MCGNQLMEGREKEREKKRAARENHNQTHCTITYRFGDVLYTFSRSRWHQRERVSCCFWLLFQGAKKKPSIVAHDSGGVRVCVCVSARVS